MCTTELSWGFTFLLNNVPSRSAFQRYPIWYDLATQQDLCVLFWQGLGHDFCLLADLSDLENFSLFNWPPCMWIVASPMTKSFR